VPPVACRPMTISVRDFRPADTGAVALLRHTCVPYVVTTEEGILFEVRTAHPARKYRLLVTEEKGVLTGTAHVGIAHESTEPGQSYVTPQIHPQHRGRGAGALLLRAAEEHLAAEGATSVYSWVLDEPASRSFAERHGYRPTRPAHFQRLDLTRASLPETPQPTGFELRTAADFAEDQRPLFEAAAESSSDEPGDISVNLNDYQNWLDNTWNHPCLDRELSTVVVASDGRVVAFTAAHTDGRSRYMSGMTGTLRAFRGQGLARLAKTDSLRRARAAGITEAFTSNDGDNGPMLAINKRLGYQVCATEVRHVKVIG